MSTGHMHCRPAQVTVIDVDAFMLLAGLLLPASDAPNAFAGAARAARLNEGLHALRKHQCYSCLAPGTGGGAAGM
jgi:hypothetical protein